MYNRFISQLQLTGFESRWLGPGQVLGSSKERKKVLSV